MNSLLARFNIELRKLRACWLFILLTLGAMLTIAPGVSAENLSSPLSTLFSEVQDNIKAEQYAAAARKVEELAGLASSQGYENLSSFSLLLLAQADKQAASGEKEKARFLLQQAQILSPTDPLLSLRLVNSNLLEDGSRRSELYWKFIKHSARRPSLLILSGLNFILLTLVSLSIALSLALLFYLLRKSPELWRKLTAYSFWPRNTWLSAACLLGLTILPVFLGVLLMLSLWLALLALVERASAKTLARAAGLLCLLWSASGLLLVFIPPVLKSPGFMALEAASLESYDERSELELTASAQRKPIALLALANTKILRGDVELAEKYLKQLKQTLSARDGLMSAVRQNLAAIYYIQQKFPAAKQELEELKLAGLNSFELNYNLSLLSMAEVDMSGFRTLNEKAKQQDLERFMRLSQKSAWPALSRLPFKELSAESLRFDDYLSSPQIKVLTSRQDALFASLLLGGNLVLIAGLGLVLLGLTFVAGGTVRNSEPSPGVLLFLPAMFELSTQRVWRGILLLAICLGSLSYYSQLPFRLFSLSGDLAGKPSALSLLPLLIGSFWACFKALSVKLSPKELG